MNNSLHLARKYARILSADIICFEKWTVFWEHSSRKTVSFEEQIMSKDKYPSIFSPQMETIVFIILQIFYATCAVFKIGVYSRISPSFSWGIFGHVTCLEQSRKSEKIWWIINFIITYYQLTPFVHLLHLCLEGLLVLGVPKTNEASSKWGGAVVDFQ